MYKLNTSKLFRVLQNTHTRLLLVLCIGILSSSSASLIIRAAQREVSSVVIAVYRMAIATILLVPFVYFRQRNTLISMSRRQWLLGVLSGVLLAFHFWAWITSLEYTTVASSTILVSSMPVFVVLFSPILLKENTSSVIYFGIGFAFFGGAIIAMSDTCAVNSLQIACPSWNDFVSDSALLGDSLAVLGAICGAGYFLIGRYMRSSIPVLTYIFVVYGMAAITLVVVALIYQLPLMGYGQQTYLWLLLLALVPQLIGHSSFNWSLRYLSVSYVTMVAIAEPVAATGLAWMFLREVPTWSQMVGGILCLCGIAYASRKV